MHLSRKGIEWREVVGGKPIQDITLNGAEWEAKWSVTQGAAWHCNTTAPYPLALDSVVSFEAKGPAVATKIYRGPGKTAIKVSRRAKGDDPVTFRLTIKYLPPPAAAGSDGAKEPEAKQSRDGYGAASPPGGNRSLTVAAPMTPVAWRGIYGTGAALFARHLPRFSTDVHTGLRQRGLSVAGREGLVAVLFEHGPDKGMHGALVVRNQRLLA